MRSDHLTKHVRTHIGVSQRPTTAASNTTSSNNTNTTTNANNLNTLRAVGSNLILQPQPITSNTTIVDDRGIKLEVLLKMNLFFLGINFYLIILTCLLNFYFDK